MAWQKRASERQDIVDLIVSKAIQEENLRGKEFRFELAILILKYLKLDGKLELDPELVTESFLKIQLEDIAVFVRAEEETNLILASVLSWITRTISGTCNTAVAYAEHKDPQKVLHAESSMSEV